MKGDYDVIIVGGGISGLCAARLLHQKGLRVAVLEATSRVGGRLNTICPSSDDPPFGWADLGGSYFPFADTTMINMCAELGLKTFAGHYTFNIFDKGREYRSRDWKAQLFWRHPLAAWDLANMMWRLEMMCREIPIARPWEAPHAKEWDQITFKEFLDKYCWTKCCHNYLTMIVTSLLAAKGAQISLLYFLWEMCCEGSGPYFSLGWDSFDGDGDFFLIEGGSQKLADKVALELGESVILNQPVVVIKNKENGVNVKTLHGKEFKAKYAVLSTPPVTHIKIHFDPPLPTMRSFLIQHCSLGDVMKCVLFYEEPFWEETVPAGSVTCLDSNEVVGYLLKGKEKYDNLYALPCFVYPQHTMRLNEMSDEKKQKEVCASLARILNSDKALHPLKFLHKAWSEEPYQCGGFAGYYPPGVLTSYGPAFRAPINSRIFLAGTDTEPYSRGSVFAAIESGHRAARELLYMEGSIEKSEVYAQQPSSPYQFNLCQKLMPTIKSMIILLPLLVLSIGLLMLY